MGDWATDEDFEKEVKVRKYDWQKLGEAALTRPGYWLKIGDNVPTSQVTVIRQQRGLKPLQRLAEEHNCVFESRSSDVDVETSRGRVWLRAVLRDSEPGPL